MVTETYLSIGTDRYLKCRRLMNNIVGTELSSLSKPCYNPKFIKYKQDIFFSFGVSSDETAKFLNQLDKKYSGFRLLKDDYTLLMLMAILEFSRKKQVEMAKLSCTFLALKFYSSFIHIMFPSFCDNDAWKTTLTQISTKHLFREKNGVPNAVFYVADAVYNRYHAHLSKKEVDDLVLVRFFTELRHRLAQSIKSFAEKYYELQKERAKGVSSTEEHQERMDDQIIADKIATSMCTFAQIDSRSFEEAIRRSGISRDIASSIVDSISAVDYRNKIKFIIILISKLSDGLKNLCAEQKRMMIIRKIISDAKYKNYTISKEMLNVLYSTDIGYRLKTIYKKQLVSFIAHYLVNYIKAKAC